MPEPGRKALAVLSLYQKCRRFQSLPFPGAIMDQPAAIMYLFDFISSEEGRLDLEAAEKERMESERQALKWQTRK